MVPLIKSKGGTDKLALAASHFPQFSEFPVTSVHRANADGAGHRDGRAVDVAVPNSQEGYNYVAAAAASGQFGAIGTNPDWIPSLRAQYPGVYFFSDYKQVHAHLEVAP